MLIEQGYRLEDQAAAYLNLFGKLAGAPEPTATGQARHGGDFGHRHVTGTVAKSGNLSADITAEVFQRYLQAARQSVDRVWFDRAVPDSAFWLRLDARIILHSDSWWSGPLIVGSALARKGRTTLSRIIPH